MKCFMSPLTSLSHLFEDFYPHFLAELKSVERGWRGIFDYELIVKILLMCQKIHGSLDKFLDVQVQRQKSNPSTTMLHSWEVLLFVYSARFSPKMIFFYFNQIIVFWTHLSSEFPEVLYFIYLAFWQNWNNRQLWGFFWEQRFPLMNCRQIHICPKFVPNSNQSSAISKGDL